MLAEAREYCLKGLQFDPNNEDLKKLDRLIGLKISEKEKHEAEFSKAVAETKVWSFVWTVLLCVWFDICFGCMVVDVLVY